MTPADAVVFPDRLIERTNDWNLYSGSISPGQSMSGAFNYITHPGGGLWVVSLNELNLNRVEDVLSFRAFRTQGRQGVMPVVVPRRDAMLPPFPLDDNGQQILARPPVPHDDGAFFSNGSGYAQPVIDAIITADAAMNATSVVIKMRVGQPLRGGESFSLYHEKQGWRCYEIGSVETNDVGDSVVSISPWLRDDIAALSPAEFDQPRCTMQLTDSKAMNMTFQTWPFARPNATFVEFIF